MDNLYRRFVYRLWIESQPQLIDYELDLCAKDIVHWISYWAKTYDPRAPAGQKYLPLDPFPRQEKFVRWLENRRKFEQNGVVPKSRTMGATWFCCAFALNRWLFEPGFSAGFGSRKLEYVDRIGDMDSIFEKIRYMLYALPTWFLPKGFNRDKHDKLTNLLNPANGASITGEGGDNLGRGGRKSIYFVDEAAHLEHPDSVENSLSETTNVRIDVSTPNGPGNPFARKFFAGNIPVFRLHWRDDPRKDDEWYAYQRDVKFAGNPAGLAQEVDLDFSASIEGICIPAAWVRSAVGLALKTGAAPKVAGYDVGGEGSNQSALVARTGPVVSDVVTWQGLDPTQGAWRCRDEANERGVTSVAYDANGIGAGVKGTWAASEVPLGFAAHPLLVGATASEHVWPDGHTSRQKFLNMRAELWWLMRVRFQKAHEYVTQGVEHPHEEMISIPNHAGLISELSLPLCDKTDGGKTRLEGKQKMRARGVKSPDLADALAMSLFEPVEVAGLFAQPDVARCRQKEYEVWQV